MAKKQSVINPSSVSGAAPARAPKAAPSRNRNSKHSKAAVAPEIAVEIPEVAFVIEEVEVEFVPVIARTENPMEVISRLAYGYWEARGRQGGDALEDWVRAENEYRRLCAL